MCSVYNSSFTSKNDVISNPNLIEIKFLSEFVKLADNSFRDGNQSLDKNRIRAEHILNAIPKYESLLSDVNHFISKLKLTLKLPSYEFWGGGQVIQPMSFLGENPIHNLHRISQLSPNLQIKSLFRGRQAYGFSPVSESIIQEAIKLSYKNGVKSLRIFDMMNDLDNLKFADSAAKLEAAKYDNITVIGSIAYTRPLNNGNMFQTISELVDHALIRISHGVDCIEIKDYAGNLFSIKDAKEIARQYSWPEEKWKNISASHVVSELRQGLNNNGHDDIPVHLHSHGNKAEALSEAIDAGAEIVDVGIGLLSANYTDINGKIVKNEMAFTNIRDLLFFRMLHKYNINIYEEPYSKNRVISTILKHIKQIETCIINSVGDVIDDRRQQLAIIDGLDPSLIKHHPMASGAISAMRGLINLHWTKFNIEHGGKLGLKLNTINKLKKLNIIDQHVNNPEDFNQDDHFKLAMHISVLLWEKAGGYPTVTPGAKILAEQAAGVSVIQMLNGQALDSILTKDYKDIILGRYGKNHGLSKQLGDTKLFIETLKHNIEEGGVGIERFNESLVVNLEDAKQLIDRLTKRYRFKYNTYGLPTYNDAIILAALTFKNHENTIIEPLLLKLNYNIISGSIEPTDADKKRIKFSKSLKLYAKLGINYPAPSDYEKSSWKEQMLLLN